MPATPPTAAAPEAATAAPATAAPGRAARLRALAAQVPGVAWIAAIALGIWAAVPRGYLNYDTYYALLWARDITGGHMPDYGVAVAPTPHPLVTFFGILFQPLGWFSTDAMLIAAYASLAALVYVVFRLGRDCFSWPVGLLAAVLLFTRDPIASFAVRAYVDIPFAALVLYATLLEVRRPRRGAPVFLLLAAAGLLRPEGWVFAGLYWLYLARDLDWPGRLRYAALAALGPVLWLASDLVITGNPIHSFTGTNSLAAQLERKRTLADLPYQLPVGIGYLLREPVSLAAAVGLAFAWMERRRDARWLFALLAVNLGLFVTNAVAQLPLIARYLLIAGVVLTIFAALGALGWLDLPAGARRRRWRIAGAIVCAVLIAFAPVMALRMWHLRTKTIEKYGITHDIERIVDGPAAQPYLASPSCRPIFTQNHRAVPILRYWLDGPPGSVVSAQVRFPRRGMMLAAATQEVQQKFVLDPRDRKTLDAPVPIDFRPVAGNRSWRLFASPGCRPR